MRACPNTHTLVVSCSDRKPPPLRNHRDLTGAIRSLPHLSTLTLSSVDVTMVSVLLQWAFIPVSWEQSHITILGFKPPKPPFYA